MLEEFFLTEPGSTTQATVLLPQDGNPLFYEVRTLSEKGIVCFEAAVGDDRPDEYKKIAVPFSPVKFGDLPENIKDIMSHHRLDVDVISQEYIKVPHAY